MTSQTLAPVGADITKIMNSTVTECRSERSAEADRGNRQSMPPVRIKLAPDFALPGAMVPTQISIAIFQTDPFLHAKVGLRLFLGCDG